MENSQEAVTIDDAIASHLRTMYDSSLKYDEYHQMIADLDRLAAAKERIAPARRPLSKCVYVHRDGHCHRCRRACGSAAIQGIQLRPEVVPLTLLPPYPSGRVFVSIERYIIWDL